MRQLKHAVCWAVVLICSIAVAAQTGASYDALIQQGKTQLQAGHADQALATSEQAIKLDVKDWEGYALAGGALMNLKRYDEAISRLTEAMDRAPQEKQAGLSELRKQCFAAESGSLAPAAASPTPAANTPEATTTQAEIVLWKSIEDSTNPADFQTYLTQYPEGAFAGMARRHLADVQAQAEQEQQRLRAQAAQEQKDAIAKSIWADSSTNLEWEKVDANDVSRLNRRNYAEAVEYCSTLRLAGFSDWRLPSADELQNIYHKTRGHAPPLIEGQDPKAMRGYGRMGPAGAFWTNTPGAKAGEHNVVDWGYIFSVKDGSSSSHALCVRNANQSTARNGGSK